jgi:hypothetical protein
MNAKEFQVAREQRLQAFEAQYAELKTQYAAALRAAKDEKDRTTQCVLIKSALELNQALTTLVQGFLVGVDDGSCKLTQEKIRNLRVDIERYKEQHGEIQQGRDKLHAMEQTLATLDEKVYVANGLEFVYMAVLGCILILLVVFLMSSSVRSVFNANAIPPPNAGRFA